MIEAGGGGGEGGAPPRVFPRRRRGGGGGGRPVHLNCAVDDAPEGVGDVHLGHGDLLPERQAVLDLVGGVDDHELAGVQLQGGVGHHPLDSLLLGQVGAEGG